MDAKSVIDKLINNIIPIDEVPLCWDIASVLKDKIVVTPLNKIAFGVLLEITLSNLRNSKNLLKKYMG